VSGAAGERLSSRLAWLADKYERVFDSLTTSVDQLTEPMLSATIPERKNQVRNHALHIVVIADGGYLSHRRGSFSPEDMYRFMTPDELSSDGAPVRPLIDVRGHEKDGRVLSAQEINDYAHATCARIASLLRADDERARRVVNSHYGGVTPVYEVLYVLLRHSAHHLRQLHSFMESEFGLKPARPLSPAEWEGIEVPQNLYISA
jgi:hypothetical protein